MLRASKRHHHNLGFRHDVCGLRAVPDEIPFMLAAVPDTRRVDHLSVVRWNTTRATVRYMN